MQPALGEVDVVVVLRVRAQPPARGAQVGAGEDQVDDSGAAPAAAEDAQAGSRDRSRRCRRLRGLPAPAVSAGPSPAVSVGGSATSSPCRPARRESPAGRPRARARQSGWSFRSTARTRPRTWPSVFRRREFRCSERSMPSSPKPVSPTSSESRPSRLYIEIASESMSCQYSVRFSGSRRSSRGASGARSSPRTVGSCRATRRRRSRPPGGCSGRGRRGASAASRRPRAGRPARASAAGSGGDASAACAPRAARRAARGRGRQGRSPPSPPGRASPPGSASRRRRSASTGRPGPPAAPASGRARTRRARGRRRRRGAASSGRSARSGASVCSLSGSTGAPRRRRASTLRADGGQRQRGHRDGEAGLDERRGGAQPLHRRGGRRLVEVVTEVLEVVVLVLEVARDVGARARRPAPPRARASARKR